MAISLMRTCSKETHQKFKNDVLSWPEAQKQQLLDQGVDPIFYRFQKHARVLYYKGSVDGMTEGVDASISKELPQDLSGEDEVVLGRDLLSLPDINIDGEKHSFYKEDLEYDWANFDTLIRGGSQDFHAPNEAACDQVQDGSEKSQPSHLLREQSPDSSDYYLKRQPHQSVDLDENANPSSSHDPRTLSRSNTPLLNFDDVDFFDSSQWDRRIPQSTLVQDGELTHLGKHSFDSTSLPWPKDYSPHPLDQGPSSMLDLSSYSQLGSVHTKLPPISEMQDYKSPSATAVSTSTTKGGSTSNRSLEPSPSIRLYRLGQ